MTEEQKDVLLSLLSALKRAQRKSQSLIVNPELLDQEKGEDALDVICMQFVIPISTGKEPWDSAMSSLTSILILMSNKCLSFVNSRFPA